MKKINYAFLGLIFIPLLSCSDSPDMIDEKPVVENIASKPAVEGIRIAWDYNSLVQVSDKNNTDYNGYARLVQLNDKKLMCTYESGGAILVKTSSDFGSTWSAPITVVSGNTLVNMTTPDILQLKDNSILICYNPRPIAGNGTAKFSINTIKSYDGGLTWKENQIVYEASSEFENGCWEPSALQIPSGEIQLFFSNENVYRNSNEQNISLIRSSNNGLTWSTTPEIVSFRAGKRDGMPSPILLKNQNEIVFSIEDNSVENQFKPYIIRNTITENWKQTVDANSNNRNYALEEVLSNPVYAGAPHLSQISTGEVLMSYQGTENRATNDINNADMKVVIGTNDAKNFNRKSTPFLLSSGKSALWNSIKVLDDDTIVALTTTNQFSNSSQIWMIKGRVIPEINATKETAIIDGQSNEAVWQKKSPVFIGQKSNTQLEANFTYDTEFLYAFAQVKDSQIISTDALTGSDGLNLYLDPKNRNLIASGKSIFKLELGQSNMFSIYEGENSKWKKLEDSQGIATATVKTTNGYRIEVKIPWNVLGGMPAKQTRIGYNIELREKGTNNYTESIAPNSSDKPYSWSTLKLVN
ncbi:sugar-binding protein [Flavobacterium sp. 120]|uniref:sugar-binding protein n=1 Tax=Flavobacterium sp. 120 TaxID=2135626 RepID=UPI000EB3195E|nr:sugar-binding protein [Flavobacterium sp. 120]RKS12878.1 BNR repeat protein [Flavobacterium sp. 120]